MANGVAKQNIAEQNIAKQNIAEPNIDESAFVAQGAVVKGQVSIGKNCGIWFNAVIRAEDSRIVIGDNSNVQDNCVVHVDPWVNATIGEYVTIGHGALIHGCTIGDNTLVGMGAIILNNAVIGRNCIIGAGALVLEGVQIPDNSLVVGSPAKVIRSINPEDAQKIRMNAEHYVHIAKRYKDSEER